MSRRTTGPWTLGYDPMLSPHILILSSLNEPVAVIEPCDQGDGQGCRLSDEDWDNAGLIAAAPDLLDALTVMVELAEDLSEKVRLSPAQIARVRQARILIDAAQESADDDLLTAFGTGEPLTCDDQACECNRPADPSPISC